MLEQNAGTSGTNPTEEVSDAEDRHPLRALVPPEVSNSPTKAQIVSSEDVQGLLESLGLEIPLPEGFIPTATLKIVGDGSGSNGLANLNPGSELKLKIKFNFELSTDSSNLSSLLGVPVTPFVKAEGGPQAELEITVLVESDTNLRVTATLGGGIRGSVEAGVEPPGKEILEPLKNVAKGVSSLFHLTQTTLPKPVNQILKLLMDDTPAASLSVEAKKTNQRSVVINIPREEDAFKDLLSAILPGNIFSKDCLASLKATRIESQSVSAEGHISLGLPGDVKLVPAQRGQSDSVETSISPIEKIRKRLQDRFAEFLGGKTKVKVQTHSVTPIGSVGYQEVRSCACVEVSLSQHWNRKAHTLKAIRFLRELRPNCELLTLSENNITEHGLLPTNILDRILGRDRAHQNILVAFSDDKVKKVLGTATQEDSRKTIKDKYLKAAAKLEGKKINDLGEAVKKAAENFAKSIIEVAKSENNNTESSERLENLFARLGNDVCRFSAILALAYLADEQSGESPNPIGGQPHPILARAKIKAPGIEITVGPPTNQESGSEEES